MKYKLVILLLSLVFICAVADEKPVVIHMIGDSTMAKKKPDKAPETGWGQVFGSYFNTKVKIINYAVNGKSTKTFIGEKRWDRVLELLKDGDYVFIQFGHNDEKADTIKGTSLEQYKANLIRFVEEARAKKGIPVLLTPVMRRSFKADVFYDSHGGYPDAMRSVAAEYHVPLIDMHQESKALLVSLGDEGSKKLFNIADPGVLANYPDGIRDNTHFNAEGAKAMAELAVQGIRKLELPLAKYLK